METISVGKYHDNDVQCRSMSKLLNTSVQCSDPARNSATLLFMFLCKPRNKYLHNSPLFYFLPPPSGPGLYLKPQIRGKEKLSEIVKPFKHNNLNLKT